MYRLPFSRKPKPDAAYERLSQDVSAPQSTLLYTLFTSLQIQDCIVAVLDATIDQESGVIHHEVLEVDEDGLTPDKSTSGSPSTLEIVAKSELEVLLSYTVNTQ